MRQNRKSQDPGPQFIPTEEETVLRATLNTPVLPEEEDYRYQIDLTDDQLIWRRRKIMETDGGLKTFKREFPATLEEAFAASEQCLFSPETLGYYQSNVRDPLMRGDIELEQPSKQTRWIATPNGPWAVWEEPIPGEEHLIAADVSEGVGGDASNAYVFHEATCKIVARFHGQVPWEDTPFLRVKFIFML